MEEDELEMRRRQPEAPEFATMSIDALREYIADLEEEIVRAKAMIKDKQIAKGDADAFFKN